jgi:twinkle protein
MLETKREVSFMITQAQINEIKSKTSISELIGKHIRLTKGKACCPFHEEKTPSFNVNEKEQFFKCFGCGKSGDAIAFIQEYKKVDFIEAVKIVANDCGIEIDTPKEYKRPNEPVKSKEPTSWRRVVDWFAKRGISELTLREAKIEVSNEYFPQVEKNMDAICFRYYRNGELINIKYRDAKKNFKLVSGAELILYNLDAIKDSDEVWVTEGEIDCLSFIESGITNVVSVPNGASKDRNNLQYIDNCIDLLKDKKKIHLALDNDNNGRKLRNEIAARLGISKCDYVVFHECKDANEYLVAYGKEALREITENTIPFPVEGSVTISNMEDEIVDMYHNGLPAPLKIGLRGFDELAGFVKGYMTLITGIPGHGKSDFLDEITVRMLINHGWKGGFFSPENKPTKLHISKLARKIIGKAWEGEGRMTLTELSAAVTLLNNNFWWIKQKKNFTIDNLLEAVEELIETHGIDFFVVDAWNTLYHEGDDSIYISKQLQRLSIFCENKNIHLFIVAHPYKMQKEKDSEKYRVVSPYDVKGASEWYDKLDLIISVYRDFQEKQTTIHVQKVKFSHWGNVGQTSFKYHPPSGRYLDPTENTYKQIDSWVYFKQEQIEFTPQHDEEMPF